MTTKKNASPKSARTKSPKSRKPERHVLLTGATGFVGKVVLEELVRRKDELGITSIITLVRPRKDSTPQHRFDKSIANSECFKLHADGWQKICVPIACELTLDFGGLSLEDLQLVTAKTTHIIHCAASVDFDLPIADAANANIKSALNVLDVAKRCKNLVNMVSVSTAYVSTHTEEPIHEVLQPLPRPASEMYADCLAGKVPEKQLLRETGHPNTYTFTKCIAEHLLMENHGDVPLTIVRPSVVSACMELPFRGWIDSLAGFTGFVALCGVGHLRVLAADRDKRADFVPCDVVSNRIVNSAFVKKPPREIIRHAVAGLDNVRLIGDHSDAIVEWYRRHPLDRRPGLEYIGPPGTVRFSVEEALRHKLPTRLAKAYFAWNELKTAERAASMLADRLRFLNSAFSYFTTNTFDFRAKVSAGFPPVKFDPVAFTDVVCAGAARHLLKRDESNVLIGGRAHREVTHDVLWSIKQPEGNSTIRTLGAIMKAVFRHSTSEVTFDRASFRAATDSLPEGTRIILLPTHRSYADFILVSYLAFARPELGIQIPAIAAAEEFSKIPILGAVFKKGGAFYIKRGQGRDPQLVETVHRLVREKRTIEFYIEGQRSRSRQFLAPKTGLLRTLQDTGEKFALLPISITYDRIPEEASLIRELKGAAKPKMKLSALFTGLRQLRKGELSYGRVHIRCGEAVMLSPNSDVRQVARLVMGELQENTFATEHHLRAFLAKSGVEGVSLEWLKDAIRARGGQIVESSLRGEDGLDPANEACMRYHWIHLFYGDARALWPNHPVVEHHIRNNAYAAIRPSSKTAVADPKLRAVLNGLFAPIARDYATVAAKLGSHEYAPRHASARSLIYENASLHLPNVQAALSDLVDRKILALDDEGKHVWGEKADEISAWEKACALERPSAAKPTSVVVPEESLEAEAREVGT